MSDEYEDIENWVATERKRVIGYLHNNGITSPNVGEWPAFEVAPYFAIWAVESKNAPGFVGWWAFSGDIPADYVSKSGESHPRKGLEDLLGYWRNYIVYLKQNKQPPDTNFGEHSNLIELGELLESRVNILEGWLNDDSLWEDL